MDPPPYVPTRTKSKRSESDLVPPSQQTDRERKSAAYTQQIYADEIEDKGSYMTKPKLKPATASMSWCSRLWNSKQESPQDTLFDDDLFDGTCDSVQNRNEAMVVRDILPMICPSAQHFRIRGARKLVCLNVEYLNESVNEGWTIAIPFHGPRPQPDFSLGFARSAFNAEQLQRLKPLIGAVLAGSEKASYFMGTRRMYFPFFTCEVKCSGAGLDVAERQNAHSMTLAVRGVVELFKLVNREKEINREILAFSIAHDHRRVSIYGHYPIIGDGKTEYYRQIVMAYEFADDKGQNKWRGWQFTKNVYELWVPGHIERLRSAIDMLPLADSNVSRAASSSRSAPQSTRQSNVESSSRGDGQSQTSAVHSSRLRRTPSFPQDSEPAPKKARTQQIPTDKKR